MTGSKDSSAKKGVVKQEAGKIHDETRALKDEVRQFLSIVATQSEQLARQQKVLDKMERERNVRLTMCSIIQLVVVLLLVSALATFLWMEFPGDDTILKLNVKATPTKAPWITAPVKVRFTLGEVISCAKEAFSADR